MNPKLLPSTHDSTVVAPFMIDDRVFFSFLILDSINTVTRLLFFFCTVLSLRIRWRSNLGTCAKKQKGGLSLVFSYLEVLLIQALVLSPH